MVKTPVPGGVYCYNEGFYEENPHGGIEAQIGLYSY